MDAKSQGTTNGTPLPIVIPVIIPVVVVVVMAVVDMSALPRGVSAAGSIASTVGIPL